MAGGTTSSPTFDDPPSARRDRDVTRYGTRGLLGACLGLLATALFAG
jgi:hypothetical protein